MKEHMYGVRFYMVSTTAPLKCVKEHVLSKVSLKKEDKDVDRTSIY